jgi:hypothetical protein
MGEFDDLFQHEIPREDALEALEELKKVAMAEFAPPALVNAARQQVKQAVSLDWVHRMGTQASKRAPTARLTEALASNRAALKELPRSNMYGATKRNLLKSKVTDEMLNRASSMGKAAGLDEAIAPEQVILAEQQGMVAQHAAENEALRNEVQVTQGMVAQHAAAAEQATMQAQALEQQLAESQAAAQQVQAQAAEAAAAAQQQVAAATEQTQMHAQSAAQQADAKMRLSIRIQQMRQQLASLASQDPVSEEGEQPGQALTTPGQDQAAAAQQAATEQGMAAPEAPATSAPQAPGAAAPAAAKTASAVFQRAWALKMAAAIPLASAARGTAARAAELESGSLLQPLRNAIERTDARRKHVTRVANQEWDRMSGANHIGDVHGPMTRRGDRASQLLDRTKDRNIDLQAKLREEAGAVHRMAKSKEPKLGPKSLQAAPTGSHAREQQLESRSLRNDLSRAHENVGERRRAAEGVLSEEYRRINPTASEFDTPQLPTPLTRRQDRAERVVGRAKQREQTLARRATTEEDAIANARLDRVRDRAANAAPPHAAYMDGQSDWLSSGRSAPTLPPPADYGIAPPAHAAPVSIPPPAPVATSPAAMPAATVASPSAMPIAAAAPSPVAAAPTGVATAAAPVAATPGAATAAPQQAAGMNPYLLAGGALGAAGIGYGIHRAMQPQAAKTASAVFQRAWALKLAAYTSLTASRDHGPRLSEMESGTRLKNLNTAANRQDERLKRVRGLKADSPEGAKRIDQVARRLQSRSDVLHEARRREGGRHLAASVMKTTGVTNLLGPELSARKLEEMGPGAHLPKPSAPVPSTNPSPKARRAANTAKVQGMVNDFAQHHNANVAKIEGNNKALQKGIANAGSDAVHVTVPKGVPMRGTTKALLGGLAVGGVGGSLYAMRKHKQRQKAAAAMDILSKGKQLVGKARDAASTVVNRARAIGAEAAEETTRKGRGHGFRPRPIREGSRMTLRSAEPGQQNRTSVTTMRRPPKPVPAAPSPAAPAAHTPPASTSAGSVAPTTSAAAKGTSPASTPASSGSNKALLYGGGTVAAGGALYGAHQLHKRRQGRDKAAAEDNPLRRRARNAATSAGAIPGAVGSSILNELSGRFEGKPMSTKRRLAAAAVGGAVGAAHGRLGFDKRELAKDVGAVRSLEKEHVSRRHKATEAGKDFYDPHVHVLDKKASAELDDDQMARLYGLGV